MLTPALGRCRGEYKMKKVFFMLMLFPIMYLYSQEKENISFYTDSFGFHKFTITPDRLIFKDEDQNTVKEYNRNDFQLNKNGFYYLFGKIVIFQNNGYCFHPQIDFDNEEDLINYKEFLKSHQTYIEEKNLYRPFVVYKTKYTASSELREGKTLYSSRNLGTLFLPPDSKEGSQILNPNHKPWVEGKAGYGENESIQIKTEKKFERLEILNGYVDYKNTDLYKNNSRVKTFLIKDLDNNLEFEVQLDDCVYFQDINLKQPTTNIIMYIKEVYKGDKWEDTCISSIVPY